MLSHYNVCTLNTYHLECRSIDLNYSLVDVKNYYGILDDVKVGFNDISFNEVLLQGIYTLKYTTYQIR